MTFEYSDVFPETVNDPKVTDEVREAAGKAGIEVHELVAPLRGSEDYGHYAKIVPATYFYMGNGESYPQVHTPEYDFIDSHIGTVCEIYKQLVGID